MIRMNHMEITVAPGTIATDGDNLAGFLHDVLGFQRSTFPGFEIPHLAVKSDPEASQFLFIAENDRPLPPASEDHLGFQLDSEDAVESVLARSRIWQARDARVEIRDMGLLDLDETRTRAIYIRYLLPIWFDVQHIEAKPGFLPSRIWRFEPS